MSKTIEQQLQKSRDLIQGLRRHLGELSHLDIAADQLTQMEQQLVQLEAASQECERRRAELAEHVRTTNSLLLDVKNIYAEKKKTIKNNFPQDQWSDYGVSDKR